MNLHILQIFWLIISIYNKKGYYYFLELDLVLYLWINISMMNEQITVIELKNSICRELKYRPYVIQQIHHIARIRNIVGDSHFTSLVLIVRKICGIDGMAADNPAIIPIISKMFMDNNYDINVFCICLLIDYSINNFIYFSCILI